MRKDEPRIKPGWVMLKKPVIFGALSEVMIPSFESKALTSSVVVLWTRCLSRSQCRRQGEVKFSVNKNTESSLLL